MVFARIFLTVLPEDHPGVQIEIAGAYRVEPGTVLESQAPPGAGRCDWRHPHPHPGMLRCTFNRIGIVARYGARCLRIQAHTRACSRITHERAPRVRCFRSVFRLLCTARMIEHARRPALVERGTAATGYSA